MLLGKRRFASFIKLQVSGDRGGRSFRHQSPDPPPRHNRSASSDSHSPLAMHRNFLEQESQESPGFARRLVQIILFPTPCIF